MPRLFSIAIALLLISVSLHSNASDDNWSAQLMGSLAPGATPFTSAVRNNFASWDLNHDGLLTGDEIDAALRNNDVKGGGAVALAVIKGIRRVRTIYGQDINAFTMTDITDYETSIVDNKPSEYAYDEMFELLHTRIDPLPVALFVHDFPHLEKLKQGLLGDCYFLAVVGAMVHRDPTSVKKCFADIPNGWRIHFHGTRPVEVGPPTEAQMAVNSTAGDDGYWLAVLESAFGAVRNRRHRFPAQADEPTDMIADGGEMWQCMVLLTGHKFIRYAIHHDDPAQLEKQIIGVRTHLKNALAAHALMAAGTISHDQLPPSLPPSHAYTVLSFDPKLDTITLWNPHGDDFDPHGIAGAENGYSKKNGIFTMPLADWMTMFSELLIERKEASPFRQ